MKIRHVFGICSLVLAGLLTLELLGIRMTETHSIILGTVFFVGVIMYFIRKKQWGMTILVIVLLFNMYNEHYHFLPKHIDIWPIVFIIGLTWIGIQLLFKEHYVRKRVTIKDNVVSYAQDSISVLFSDTVRHVDLSKTDQDVSVHFASLKVYVDDVINRNEDMQLDVTITFGELLLFVPKHIRVENKVNTIFGEVRTENISTTNNKTQTLYISGNVLFGEVTIIAI